MNWKQIAELDVRGRRIVAKDAMIMLAADEAEPEWPCVDVIPGNYIVECQLVRDLHCTHFRIRPLDADPTSGKQVGTLDIDNAMAAFIDYDTFLADVRADIDAYEEWTETELGDDLSVNFFGRIEFGASPLVYVTSGDGDGTYPVFELTDDGEAVGLECRFESPPGQ